MSDVAAGSPLEKLRAAAAKRRKGAELYLPLPGWDEPQLVARVVVVGEDALTTITGDPGSVDWMADFVACSVAGLYAYNGKDLTPVPGGDGAPLRFGSEFGAAIGQPDVETPRAAVFAAFMDGGDGAPPTLNVVALGEFSDAIERWQANTSRRIAGAVAPGS